jgi:DNA uptake protein ComE-like DNA-binding protein
VATTGEGEALEQAQAGAHAEAVEKDLLALRLAQDPALPLRDADEVRRAAALGWRLDVNRATAADWRRLPGCRPEQVDLLLRLQRGGVQLSGPEDLGELLQLDSATLQCWLPLLSFSWYGTPAGAPASAPVPVNQASAAELGQLPELTADRCARLLRERSRSPFRDLADLRDRLSLPPAIAERWIGRVSFAPGPAGPSLPRSGPSLPPAGDRSSRRRP